MKFSNKNNLLRLQDAHGRFWVDKIQISPKIVSSQIKHIQNGETPIWSSSFGRMLSGIFDKENFNEEKYFSANKKGKKDIGNFVNLFFAKSLVSTIKNHTTNETLNKTAPAFIGLYSQYGSIIIDNEVSILFYIDNGLFVFSSFVGSYVTVIECVSITGSGDSNYAIESDFISENPNYTKFDLFYAVIPMLAIYYFAEIETSIIDSSKSKKVVLSGEKYLNENAVPVKIINSNWFTTIIRSEGFGVRGHFRLQPCGEGRNERKLIWIKDFVKNGYTRIAGKESENLTTPSAHTSPHP